MPTTKTGKWSLGLIIAMPVLFFVGSSLTNQIYGDVPAGNTIIEDLANRPLLAGAMLAGMLAGISAFVTGLIAIWKDGDRAFLTYVSTIIGLLLLLLLLGEIIFPH